MHAMLRDTGDDERDDGADARDASDARDVTDASHDELDTAAD